MIRINMIASTPQPPYYVVIFSNVRTDVDDGYDAMAERMFDLASQQDGFLGMEHARDELGITLSYWKSLESIKNWKAHAEHLEAQRLGKSQWYGQYKTRIALVERDYSFAAE
jgi:heme-degrading monooxygenase HmoA